MNFKKQIIDEEKDILVLFENLSNHEVFTPPSVARDMIELLPKSVFDDPHSKFLDPTCKSGVFLRELFFKLYSTLPKDKITIDNICYDLSIKQERINHILKNMLFGVAISETTAYMSRRTLYGVMLTNGNKENATLEVLAKAESSTDKKTERKKIDHQLDEFINDPNFINKYFDNLIFKEKDKNGNELIFAEGNIFYPHNIMEEILQYLKLNKSKKNNSTNLDEFSESEESEKFFPLLYKFDKTNKFILNKYNEVLQKIRTKKMKFDIVIGNPPFLGKSETHQQFFNFGVDVLKDNGVICFIQPATIYHNKKSPKKNSQKMQQNVLQYNTEVIIKSPSIFKGAEPSTDISITLLTKTPNPNNNIKSITYKNGNNYKNIGLDKISMTEIEPTIYDQIKQKYKTYIEHNGSLRDIESINGVSFITKEKVLFAASLAKVRGHRSDNGFKDDYFSFISKDDISRGNNPTHGIICNENEIPNVHAYLKTKIARFGLTFLKFNTNVAMGELAMIPKVDFSKIWNDKDLKEELLLTDEEFNIIDNFIPSWNIENEK